MKLELNDLSSADLLVLRDAMANVIDAYQKQGNGIPANDAKRLQDKIQDAIAKATPVAVTLSKADWKNLVLNLQWALIDPDRIRYLTDAIREQAGLK